MDDEIDTGREVIGREETFGDRVRREAKEAITVEEWYQELTSMLPNIPGIMEADEADKKASVPPLQYGSISDRKSYLGKDPTDKIKLRARVTLPDGRMIYAKVSEETEDITPRVKHEIPEEGGISRSMSNPPNEFRKVKTAHVALWQDTLFRGGRSLEVRRLEVTRGSRTTVGSDFTYTDDEVRVGAWRDLTPAERRRAELEKVQDFMNQLRHLRASSPQISQQGNPT